MAATEACTVASGGGGAARCTARSAAWWCDCSHEEWRDSGARWLLFEEDHPCLAVGGGARTAATVRSGVTTVCRKWYG
ncbi:Ribonuclease H [Sesbania bispinosa]|nr:Ribonuclease H [Sesbania bispinosa]